MKHETLAAALIAARAEFPAIAKDSTNPHFKSKFASLDSVLAAVVPVLARHGLAVLQPVRGRAVETTVLHETGETFSSAYPLPDQDDPQKLGAAVTYARRYSLCALLGVVADEDDDGNAASAPPRSRAPRQQPQEGRSEPRHEAQPVESASDALVREQMQGSLAIKAERQKANLLFWMEMKKHFGEVEPWLSSKSEDASAADIANAGYKRIAIRDTFGTGDLKAIKQMGDAEFLQLFRDNFESALDVAIKTKKEAENAEAPF